MFYVGKYASSSESQSEGVMFVQGARNRNFTTYGADEELGNFAFGLPFEKIWGKGSHKTTGSLDHPYFQSPKGSGMIKATSDMNDRKTQTKDFPFDHPPFIYTADFEPREMLIPELEQLGLTIEQKGNMVGQNAEENMQDNFATFHDRNANTSGYKEKMVGQNAEEENIQDNFATFHDRNANTSGYRPHFSTATRRSIGHSERGRHSSSSSTQSDSSKASDTSTTTASTSSSSKDSWEPATYDIATPKTRNYFGLMTSELKKRDEGFQFAQSNRVIIVGPNSSQLVKFLDEFELMDDADEIPRDLKCPCPTCGDTNGKIVCEALETRNEASESELMKQYMDLSRRIFGSMQKAGDDLNMGHFSA